MNKIKLVSVFVAVMLIAISVSVNREVNDFEELILSNLPDCSDETITLGSTCEHVDAYLVMCSLDDEFYFCID